MDRFNVKEATKKGYKLVLEAVENCCGYTFNVKIYDLKGKYIFSKPFYYEIEAERSFDLWLERGFKVEKGLLHVND